MTDKCAPHPWARAQNRPSQAGKKKSILLLFILCDLFAHRYTPDTHTKWTHTTSVIYSTLKDPTETGKKTNLHHRVFLNTQMWDSHPIASPEGLGTTPSEKCQQWSDARPLGAAMRLTALRQSPPKIPYLRIPGTQNLHQNL
jgi:hypothetical protein